MPPLNLIFGQPGRRERMAFGGFIRQYTLKNAKIAYP